MVFSLLRSVATAVGSTTGAMVGLTIYTIYNASVEKEEFEKIKKEFDDREEKWKQQQQEFIDEMDDKNTELKKSEKLMRIKARKDELTRNKMLDEMVRAKNADLKAQKLKYEKLAAEKIKQEQQRAKKFMADKQLEIEEKEIAVREKDSLMREQMKELETKYREEQVEMMKIIEKKNYECHYPIPDSVAELYVNNPGCFAIQILG